jgi:tetratricopeptide (TPR) repeat protein
LALAEMPRDFPIIVSTQFNLAMIQHAQGRVAEALEMHRKTLAMLSGDLNTRRFGWPAPPSIFARAFASWYLVELGRFGEAERMLDEAELPIAVAGAHGKALVDTGRGYLLMRRGAFARAAEVLRGALDLCRRAEVLTVDALVVAWLGRALCGVGRVEEALALMVDAVDREIYKYGGKYNWVYLRLALAEGYRLAGQLDKAASEAELAHRIAIDCGEIVHQAYALLEKGRIALARGDAESALGAATSALSIASERGLQPFVAECQWVQGRAHEALGRSDAAGRAFGDARAIWTIIGLDDGVFEAPTGYIGSNRTVSPSISKG